MERESIHLLTLSILVLTSVVSLAAIGVTNFTIYLALVSLAYFSNNFVLSPRRRGIDITGVALLALLLLLVGLELR